MEAICDFCAYNEYDEEDESYYCSVNMDEDDMARFVSSSYRNCPFLEMGMSTRWYVIRCKSEILLYEQYSRIFFLENY